MTRRHPLSMLSSALALGMIGHVDAPSAMRFNFRPTSSALDSVQEEKRASRRERRQEKDEMRRQRMARKRRRGWA